MVHKSFVDGERAPSACLRSPPSVGMPSVRLQIWPYRAAVCELGVLEVHAHKVYESKSLFEIFGQVYER